MRIGFTPLTGTDGGVVAGSSASFAPTYAALEAACDVLYVLDLLFTTRLAFWHQMCVVVDPVEIWRHYWHTTLPISALSSAPAVASLALSYRCPLVRLPTVLRLLHLPAISEEVVLQFTDQSLAADSFILRKLRTMLACALYLTHVIACLHGAAHGAADAPSAAFEKTYSYAFWWSAGVLSTLGGTRGMPREIGALAFSTATRAIALLSLAVLLGLCQAMINELWFYYSPAQREALGWPKAVHV